MSSPYREGSHPAGMIHCPRCNKPLPPLDVATCDAECGTWVTAEVATIALTSDELVEDRLTRWWRVRAPCPICAKPMTLRGLGEGLFQGCTKHGYFLDTEIVRHTGLGRVGVADAVESYRASIEQRRLDEVRRAAEREERARAEAEERRIAEQQRRAAEAERAAAAERQAAEAEKRAAEQRAEAEKRAADKRAKAEWKAAQRRAKEERKVAEKRAAAERERAEREQHRIALVARVNEAVARGTADILVDEIMRLEDRIAAIERKLKKVVTFE